MSTKVTIEYNDFLQLMKAAGSKDKTLSFSLFVKLSHKLYNAYRRSNKNVK